jgi:hypothetical protein
MKNSIVSISILVILLCLGPAVGPSGQEIGDMVGTVTGADGSPLPGVNVTLTGPQLLGVRTTITNEAGYFRFTGIPAGAYTVHVEMAGFKTLEKSGINVAPGQSSRLSIYLDLSGVLDDTIVVNQGGFAELTPAQRQRLAMAYSALGENIEQLQAGWFVYNPPERMRVGESERIELRITRNIRVDLEKELKGTGSPITGRVITGILMKARLTGREFNVESLSEENQVISPEGLTQWEWEVTPQESGTHTLFLSVAVIILSDDFGRQTKSLPVLEHQVSVRVPPGEVCKKVFQLMVKYLDLILGGVLVALVWYLLRKYLERKRKTGRKNRR